MLRYAAKPSRALLCVLAHFICGCCQHSCTDAAGASVNDSRYLDLIHEASPVSFAQQSPNKSLGLKVFKLVHVLTYSSPAVKIAQPRLVIRCEQRWKRAVLGVS